MNEFTFNVIKIIKNIPKGKILTYGHIAALAGNRRGARQVSWTLKSMTRKYDLPWFRVVNSRGEISIKTEEGYGLQKSLLLDDGVEFDSNDKIDLDKYMWDIEDINILEGID